MGTHNQNNNFGNCCFLSIPDDTSLIFIEEIIKYFKDGGFDLVLGFVGFSKREEEEFNKYKVEIIRQRAGWRIDFLVYDHKIKNPLLRLLKWLFVPNTRKICDNVTKGV